MQLRGTKQCASFWGHPVFSSALGFMSIQMLKLLGVLYRVA